MPQTLFELVIPKISSVFKRQYRHARKLEDEKSKFGDYKLIHVWLTFGRHAETEIVSVVKDFDYIAGLRRPCTDCFIYMQAKGVPSDKYNSHHGAYWATERASLALKDHVEDISETKLDGNFWYNEGSTGDERFAYDTDSEDEE